MSENEKEKQQESGREAAGAAGGQEICFTREEIQTMMTDLDEKNRQAEELNGRLLRLQADFDNFRRRSRQEKEELSQVVAGNVILEILPVLDNFQRALAAAPAEEGTQLMAGMELVFRQLVTALEKFGLEPIEAVNSQFDPAWHEAVMRVEDPCQPDGLIVEELQKGYKVQGKVIRPSMVKVVGNS
ncbi:MAG TPA: nucleotide exchange factor GrpE [Selenomonadales bacterium]|nr:nucleotide exchange factor GrpE [Selenomonadales bacterium]